MAGYKNLAMKLQLTDRQKEQWLQYYDANKLLRDCMANKTVSNSVKQEVEMTLLLPMGDG